MSRISNLKKIIPEGIDGILLTNEKSQKYLGGFDYSNGYFLVTRKHAYLITDSRYIESAKEYETDEMSVVLFTTGLYDAIKDILCDIKVLGFEDNWLTVAGLERLKKALKDIEFRPIGGIVDGLREIKDLSEIEDMTKAQRIAEKALDHLLGMINYDMTEKEVAFELEMTMKKLGAQAEAFQTIAVSGSASSLPHGVPRDVKLEKGFLTMDFGANYRGYCSDMTRTVVIGKADDEMKKIYNTVLEAQLRALDFLRAGVTGSEYDGVARKVIEDAGYGKFFGHGLGHGVGLYIHEAPGCGKYSKNVLKAGNVVTCEPGIYIEGKYGVRIEDMVVVTETGHKNLALADKKLIEI